MAPTQLNKPTWQTLPWPSGAHGHLISSTLAQIGAHIRTFAFLREFNVVHSVVLLTSFDVFVSQFSVSSVLLFNLFAYQPFPQLQRKCLGVLRRRESVTAIGKKMGGNSAQLAYVIVYVPDVNKAAEFYHKAFGLAIRPQNKSNSWVELETGATTLAFTPVKQHETELIGGVPSSGTGHDNIEINLAFPDVEAAFKHAIAHGAAPVADPADKIWPQKVSYVKDIFGNRIRLGSFVATTS